MAVLVEAISVIIRRDIIEAKFPGGWEAFRRRVPNNTLCFDESVARVGFMSPTDVGAFTSELIAAGLAFHPDGEAVDFAVVDQLTGPTVPAPWLAFGKLQDGVMQVSACWIAGQPPSSLALPERWTYEGSISAEPGFVANGDIKDQLQFLRRENSTDVYLDLRTGEEMFQERPEIAGETREAVSTRLNSLFHEALNIKTQMGASERSQDQDGLTPHFDRLRDELLPIAKELAAGAGRDIWLAHFDLGLVFRMLTRLEEAELAFLKANELRPGVINTLLELVLCLGQMGRDAEALPFAREAIIVAPLDAGAWGNLALTLLRCGERAEGRKAIDYAIYLDPDDAINQRLEANFEKL